MSFNVNSCPLTKLDARLDPDFTLQRMMQSSGWKTLEGEPIREKKNNNFLELFLPLFCVFVFSWTVQNFSGFLQHSFIRFSLGYLVLSHIFSLTHNIFGFWCHRLELSASPRRICAVTSGFQTTTQNLSVFPFLPRHYCMTRVLLSSFITTVWTPVVLAIINII